MMNDETEAARLRHFWDERYQQFSLNESGIKGLNADYIALLYRCKLEAWRGVLRRAGMDGRTGLRILDAGCGQGFFADAAERELKDADYTGVDISEKAVTHLRQTRPRHRWICGDFCSRDFDTPGPFDLIQSIEVMHLVLNNENVAIAMAHFARLLKPDGMLLLTDTLPARQYQPTPHIMFRPRAFYEEAARRAGLWLTEVRWIYYFIPSCGWTVPPLRQVFVRLPPKLVYAMDRAALALKLPRFWTTHDSQMKTLVFRRS